MPARKRDILIRQLNLTDADVAAIKSAANDTWAYIGYDVLQATAEDQDKSIDAVTVSRADVIELVLDADRITDQLCPRQGVDPLSPAGRHFITQIYHEPKVRQLMQLLMKETFTYSRYGM